MIRFGMIVGYDIYMNNPHRIPLIWPETMPDIKNLILTISTNYIHKY